MFITTTNTARQVSAKQQYYYYYFHEKQHYYYSLPLLLPPLPLPLPLPLSLPLQLQLIPLLLSLSNVKFLQNNNTTGANPEMIKLASELICPAWQLSSPPKRPHAARPEIRSDVLNTALHADLKYLYEFKGGLYVAFSMVDEAKLLRTRRPDQVAGKFTSGLRCSVPLRVFGWLKEESGRRSSSRCWRPTPSTRSALVPIDHGRMGMRKGMELCWECLSRPSCRRSRWLGGPE